MQKSYKKNKKNKKYKKNSTKKMYGGDGNILN